jgi:hypothetical protein
MFCSFSELLLEIPVGEPCGGELWNLDRLLVGLGRLLYRFFRLFKKLLSLITLFHGIASSILYWICGNLFCRRPSEILSELMGSITGLHINWGRLFNRYIVTGSGILFATLSQGCIASGSYFRRMLPSFCMCDFGRAARRNRTAY